MSYSCEVFEKVGDGSSVDKDVRFLYVVVGLNTSLAFWIFQTYDLIGEVKNR